MTQKWSYRARTLAIWPAAFLGFLSLAPAATITVSQGPAGFHDLQAAVDAAREGDTVLVEPGEYTLTESLDLNRQGSDSTKNLIVRSTGGAAKTVLRMAGRLSNPDRASVVVFDSGENPRSVLEGFTLTGGRGFTAANSRGGGIYCSQSSPTIKDSIIHRNAAQWGAGIYVESGVPVLTGCAISNNSATQGGGGVYVDNPRDAAYPTFRECRIVENVARDGGGVFANGSSRPILEKCSLWGNRSQAGGALLSQGSSYPQVTNCLIAGNSSLLGGGMLARGSSYPYLTNCTFSDNLAANGGGIACGETSYPRITNCILWDNPGGSLVLGGQAYPAVNFSCIEDNPATGARNGKNVSADPLFAHPGQIDDQGTADPLDDVSTLGDYRLLRRSGVIDAGTASLVMDSSFPLLAPETDMDGNKRPCWSGVDMGAYEYCGADVPGPIPDIVFVSRALDVVPAQEPGAAVTRATRGSLLILRTATNELQPLVDAFGPGARPDTPRDVLDPDVSFDGKWIVFSGYSQEEQAWRIYETAVNGSELRQVTRTDRQLDLSRYGEAAPQFERYDDLDPCYLPDGRICFVSTRYPESAPEGRSRATNLYLTTKDGKVRRLTSERFAADTPAVDPATGDVVFSRWWRTPEVRSGSGVVNPALPPEEPGSPAPPPAVPPGSPRYGNQVDVPEPGQIEPGQVPRPSTFRERVLVGVAEEDFPGVNSWFLSSIHLDGTGLAMLSGFHLDRVATQAYRPSFLPNGEVLALFLTETPLAGRPGVFGLRRYERGPSFPVALGGPQDFVSRATPFLYHSAVALPDGRFLVTGSRGGERLPGRFDIFVQESKDAAPAHLFGFEDRAELDALPVLPRPLPNPGAVSEAPVLPEAAPRNADEAVDDGGSFTFQVENLFGNAEVDAPIPNAPPLGRRLFMEFYMAPQRTSLLAADPPLLLKRLEVPPSGKFEVELPAGVPLFEMLRRPDGTIASGRDGQIFHVGGLNYGTPGKKAVCVGCHAGHSMMEVPLDASFTNLAPSAQVSASSFRRFGDLAMRPVLLVDRRTDFFRSEWAAAPEDMRPSVRLSWGVPIRAREVVLHGARTGPGAFGPRNHTVNRVTLRTFLAGSMQETWTFNQSVTVNGVHLNLNEERAFDTLEVQLNAFTGPFEGGPGAALSEIEVIARAAGSGAPTVSFMRGDANCSANVDLSDMIGILGSLFLGAGPPCCAAGADANGDGGLDISDPVFLINYLFRSGALPPAPFPSCGQLAEGDLSCDQEACR